MKIREELKGEAEKKGWIIEHIEDVPGEQSTWNHKKIGVPSNKETKKSRENN